MIVAAPVLVVSLYLPFPSAWVAMFVSIFCLFLEHRAFQHRDRECFRSGGARDGFCP